MSHLQHSPLKRECRTAEQIHHSSAILRVNVFQIQENTFALEQILDNLSAFFNLTNVDNTLTVCILNFLCSTRIHTGIMNHIAAASGGTRLTRSFFLVIFVVLIFFLISSSGIPAGR